MQQWGGGNPGDSDGNDNSNGGGSNGPQRDPWKLLTPNNPQKNPSSITSGESTHLINKWPLEAQFDIKLKLNVIPLWDGNPETLRHWLLNINSLAK